MKRVVGWLVALLLWAAALVCAIGYARDQEGSVAVATVAYAVMAFAVSWLLLARRRDA